MVDHVNVKAVSSSGPYDEAMLRLSFAEQLAAYLAINEGDELRLASNQLVAGVAGAIQTLISDADCLLAQAFDDERAKRNR